MNETNLADTIQAFEQSLSDERTFCASPEDFSRIIEYYLEQDYCRLALEATEQAILRYPGHNRFYLTKARILIQSQCEKQAMALLSEVKATPSDELSIRLLQVEALTRLGRYAKAIEQIDDLKWKMADHIPAELWVAEALVFEARQEYERMYFALRTALQVNPRHTEALERMGVCIDLTRQYEESIRLHESILSADPFSHYAWYNLGQAQAHIGLYEEAIQSFEYAFLADEHFEDAYWDCAELCLETGKPQKALQCYLEALERFEPHNELYFQLGCCYETLELYEHAIHFFSEVIRHEPYDDEARFRTGRCYAARKMWRKAIRHFNEALELEEQREEYHLALAEALECTGQTKQAAAHFEHALDLAPDNEACILAGTRFLYRLKQYEKALHILGRYQQDCDNDSPELLYAYIACLYAAGRTAEALYRLGEAMEYHPEEVHLLWDWAPELRQWAEQCITAGSRW